MTHEYFVHDGQTGQVEGPLDFLMISQRIRRRRLDGDAQVSASRFEAPVPASAFPELLEILREVSVDTGPSVGGASRDEALLPVLREGIGIFVQHQSTTVVTGIVLLAIFLGAGLLSLLPLGIVSRALAMVWAQYLLWIYVAAMMRKQRNRMLDGDFLRAIGNRWLPLVGLAAITAVVPLVVPAIVTHWALRAGWLLAIFPGMFVFTYFVFSPMLMIEREIGIGETLAANHALFRQLGLPVMTTMFLLVLLNVLVPIPPVTMPITFLALAAIYDRRSETI